MNLDINLRHGVTFGFHTVTFFQIKYFMNIRAPLMSC